MKEKIIAAAGSIRCAEEKLTYLHNRREALQAELRRTDASIAGQEKAKTDGESALTHLMGELSEGRSTRQNLNRHVLDDLVALRAALTRKIQNLEGRPVYDPITGTFEAQERKVACPRCTPPAVERGSHAQPSSA